MGSGINGDPTISFTLHLQPGAIGHGPWCSRALLIEGTPRPLVAEGHHDAPIAPWLAAFILEAARRVMEVGAPDLRDRLLDPDDLARRFAREHIRRIGQATPEFFHNVKALGKPWYDAGVPSAGNGAAMRAASCCASVQRPSASPA